MANELPKALEAERSVLGSILINTDALLDVVQILKADDFYNPANRIIFEAILSLYEKGKTVDVTSIISELSPENLQKIGGELYIIELTENIPSSLAASEYAKIVKEKRLFRDLISVSQKTLTNSFAQKETDFKKVLETHENDLLELIEQKNDAGYISASEAYKKAQEEILRRKDRGGLLGLTTGFKEIDKYILGLSKGLIIIGARPSVGKTTLALNIAQNASLIEDATVLFFSLEMPSTTLSEKMLSSLSHVPQKEISTGRVFDDPSSDAYEKLNEAAEKLSKMKFYIDDSSLLSVGNIRSNCMRVKRKKGRLDLVVVDYLGLIDDSEYKENRTNAISAMTRSLKILSKELSCPIILLSQLSRLGASGRPKLSHLRDSGSIEQDADVVMFIYRKEYDEADTVETGMNEILIEKNRYGERGVKGYLTWDPECSSFYDARPEEKTEYLEAFKDEKKPTKETKGF